MAITHTHHDTSSHALSEALHDAVRKVAFTLVQWPMAALQKRQAIKEARLLEQQRDERVQKQQTEEGQKIRLHAVEAVLPEPKKEPTPERIAKVRAARLARRLEKARSASAQMAASNFGLSNGPR
jgi:hypothetical protein